MAKTVGFYMQLDEDIVNGLRRLKKVFRFPIAAMVSESLRPFVNTYLPLADLYEEGKLTQAELMQAFMKGVQDASVKFEQEKADAEKMLKQDKRKLTKSIKAKSK